MPTYTVRDPEGNIHKVEGPADATEEEIIAQGRKLLSELDPNDPYFRTRNRIPPSGETISKGAMASTLGGIPIAGEALASRVATPEQRKEFEQYFPGQAWAAGALGGAGAMAPLAAVAPAAFGASRAMGPIGNALTGGASQAAIGAADAAARGQSPWPAGTVSGAIGAAAPFVGRGAGAAYRGAEHLARPVSGPLAGLGGRATRMLIEGLQGVDPQKLAIARQTLGPSAFAGELTPGLFDVTRGVAGGADEAANAVKGAYTDRLAGGRGRMEGAINQNMGVRQNIPQTLEQVLEERSRQAKPLYDAAMAMPVPPDPRLREFLIDPDIQKGIVRGAEDAKREALALGQPYNPSGFRLLANGKIGLDNLIDDEKDAVTGRLSAHGRSLEMLRKAYVQKLDDLNPDYKVARAAWEGPTKVHAAIRDGGEALNRSVSADELKEELAGMNAAQRAGYAIGLRNYIAKLMDASRTGDVSSRTLLMSPAAKEKIAAVFGTNPADELSGFFKQEADIAQRTMAVVPNQATGASNISRQEALKLANPPSRMADYLKGIDLTRPQTLLGANLNPQSHIDETIVGANARARSQLAPVLTAPVDDDLIRALMAAKQRQEGIGRRGLAMERGGAFLTAVPGPQQARRELQ